MSFGKDEVKEVGAMVEGEVWYKTPTVMLEYLNNPDHTTSAYDSEGWFKSGTILFS